MKYLGLKQYKISMIEGNARGYARSESGLLEIVELPVINGHIVDYLGIPRKLDESKIVELVGWPDSKAIEINDRLMVGVKDKAASEMGSRRSARKTAAARENGKKGGRYARLKNAGSLWELYQELRTGKWDQVENMAYHLPTWGEQPDVSDRDDVYSWDEEDLLVSSDGSWEIEPRTDK